MVLANNLKRYLYEWFLEKDSLIVPHLGKFEANYLGATIQPGIHKFSPPNKVITFDPSVQQDDGVFASYISQNAAVSPEEAQGLIHSFVEEIQQQLDLHKKYRIESFGTLLKMPDNSLVFQTEEDLNYLGESYGLSNLYAKPNPKFELNEQEVLHNLGNEKLTTNYNFNQEEKLSPDLKQIEEDDEIIIEEELVDTSTRRWVMGLVVAVIVLSSVFALFLLTDTNPFALFSNNNNSVKTEDSLTTQNQNTADESAKKTEENQDKGNENTDNQDKNKPEDKAKNNPKVNSEPEVIMPKINFPTDDSFIKSFAYNPAPPANLNQVVIKKRVNRYYVIVGSFDKVANAYSFHNNLIRRGVGTAKIIAPGLGNTKYRIALGDYATEQDATVQGNSFGSRNRLNYWIYAY
jgi:hypothetical protein